MQFNSEAIDVPDYHTDCREQIGELYAQTGSY